MRKFLNKTNHQTWNQKSQTNYNLKRREYTRTGSIGTLIQRHNYVHTTTKVNVVYLSLSISLLVYSSNDHEAQFKYLALR